MNRFQFLTGPCLVCKKIKPGAAWGITPEIAVCDDDWVADNDKAVAAINKAGQKEGLVAKSEGKQPAGETGDLATQLERLTVAQALEKVDAGEWSVAAVLEAEEAGQGRVSLIGRLKERLEEE